MSIRVALNHKTLYRYTRPVWLSPHVVRLRPAPHCRMPIPSYSLKVTPADHFINWQQDPYSNHLARQMIAVRVLLPVDEMIGGRDLKRIAGNRHAAMGRRAQAHN